MNRQLLTWALVFFAMALIFQYGSQSSPNAVVELSPSALSSEIQKKNIKQIDFYQESLKIEGLFSSVDKDKSGKTSFKSAAVNAQHLDEIRKLAEANSVSYKVNLPPNPYFGIMLNIVLWLGVFLLVFWFINKQQMKQLGGKGGPFEFISNRARKMPKDGKAKKTFADVAGCDEAKESLQEVVEFLKDPLRFAKLGGKVPRGILLYGQPGTGKTLLAKAVAGEAGAEFFSISGSEFVEMFVGVGAARVRSLFAEARKAGRAIIFIDELDAVGRHRFAGVGGGHDEREQTLNQILTELDGFDTTEGIIVLASTNRPDVLDKALLRPGRFDRHVQVPAPDLNGRIQILKVHAVKIKLHPEVDLQIVAKRTPGFVGADLENLLNESALLAAKKNKESVEQTDIEQSIETVIAGPQKRNRLITEKEKKIIAYHECGHTLSAVLTPGTDPVHKVSIISRGQALGYTLQLPEQDRVLLSKEDLFKRIRVLLGGRVAEELLLGKEGVTGGACDDLNKATHLLERMVMEFGMGSHLSVISAEGTPVNQLMAGQNIPSCSEQRRQEIHDEVEKTLRSVYEEVRNLLNFNRQALDALAGKLLEKEELNGEEILQIVRPSV